MTLRLSVRLAADTANEKGYPPEWPVYVEEVHDDSVFIAYPNLAMTRLEYQQYRDSYQGAYDAWEMQQELIELRRVTIDKLWQAAYDYNFQFFSGGAYAQILEMKMGGVKRALQTQNWIFALWADYYTRKYMVSQMTTLDAMLTFNLDFSNNGNPPWSVPEMLAEAMGQA